MNGVPSQKNHRLTLRPKLPVKIFLSLIFIAGLASLAPAAPYIVYSGEGIGGDFSSSGAAKKATLLYLITDVADTSSFALMQVNAAGKVYEVIARPSASPTTEETNNNFLGGITTSSSKSGMAVLSYSSDTTDSNNNTFVAHAYATGPLMMRNATLVMARVKPLTVNLKTNGAAIGTYSFSVLTPAITTGGTAFPISLSGVFFNYEIASDGSLANATTQGNFTLKENPVLTSLANIGGAYTVGKNTAAVLPVTIPNGTSPADVYSAWLAAFAQLNGFSLPGSGNSGDFSGGTISLGNTSSYGGAVTLSGGISLSGGGTGIVTVGAGTLTLNNSGTTVGVLTPTSVGNAFTGVLTLGGVLTTLNNSGGTTITQVDNTPGDSGATLTLNTTGLTVNGGGTLTLTGTGTIGMGSGTLNLGPGANMLVNGETLVLVSGTITVTAVNNGLVDGTIASTSLNTITFTGATLIVDGVNSGATLTPGAIVTGGVSLKGGSLTNINGVVTDTASTLTVVTTP